MSKTCAWPHCRNTEIDVVYFGKPLCETHWGMVADESPKRAAAARIKMGLGAKLPKMEHAPMPEPTRVVSKRCTLGTENNDTDLNSGAGDVLKRLRSFETDYDPEELEDDEPTRFEAEPEDDVPGRFEYEYQE